MFAKWTKRGFAVVLAAALSICGTAGTAYAWNEVFTSPVRYTSVGIGYHSYNTAAYTKMGYYFMDTNSTMNIAAEQKMTMNNMIEPLRGEPWLCGRTVLARKNVLSGR